VLQQANKLVDRREMFLSINLQQSATAQLQEVTLRVAHHRPSLQALQQANNNFWHRSWHINLQQVARQAYGYLQICILEIQLPGAAAGQR
jgi:hypothetical protein